jgi:hypothetical protein
MKPAEIIEYLWSYLAPVYEISEETKSAFIAEAELKLPNVLTKNIDQHPQAILIYFQILRSEVLKTLWTTIDPEERIYICFPKARKVGEELEIPKRGMAKVLWRELTEKQGLKMGFQLKDGTIFSHEFFD